MGKQQLFVRVEPEHDFRVKVFVPWQRKDWIAKIKSLPNRAWNKEHKYWSVPKDEAVLGQLTELFGTILQISTTIHFTNSKGESVKTNQEIGEEGLKKLIPKLSLPTDLLFKEVLQDGRTFKVFVGQKIAIRKANEGWLQVWIPYDKKDWIKIIKNIPGRKWQSEVKCWLIPYVKDTCRHLWKLVGSKNISINFKISPNIPAAYFAPSKKSKQQKTIQLNEMQRRAITALEEKLILEGKRWKTIKTYKYQLRSFLRFYKDKRPSSISLKAINRYIIIRKKQDNISDSYLNQLINALNAFYARVLEQEEKVAKLERPPKRKKLPNVFSEEEVKLILTVCENLKHKCMLMLTYSAGLRKQEVLNLRVNDLNFDRKTIFVKNGKGGKDRFTFLSDIAMKYLKIYLAQNDLSLWLFEGQYGGQYSASSLQSIFEKAKKKAKVNHFVTLHGLRHSFATHLVEKLVPLHVVQELLGHSSIKTTEIYLHISNKYRKELKSPLDTMGI